MRSTVEHPRSRSRHQLPSRSSPSLSRSSQPRSLPPRRVLCVPVTAVEWTRRQNCRCGVSRMCSSKQPRWTARSVCYASALIPRVTRNWRVSSSSAASVWHKLTVRLPPPATLKVQWRRQTTSNQAVVNRRSPPSARDRVFCVSRPSALPAMRPPSFDCSTKSWLKTFRYIIHDYR